VTPEDESFLRRAIELAAAGLADGEAPLSSLLVGPDRAILAEDHNTVLGDRGISAHPELKLARWAAREFDAETAARTTMYTSCEACPMCTGGIDTSGLGRVVHALSAAQLNELKPSGGPPWVPQEGPALLDEAWAVAAGYYADVADPGALSRATRRRRGP
jgi:tRNA(Arg) A34 adenosine deaminase TadA